MYQRDYDHFLTLVLEACIVNLNNKWATPFDFAKIDPTFEFIRGMIKNTRVTPFVQDGYLYLGFSYFLDNMVATKQDLISVTQRFVDAHFVELYQVFESWKKMHKKKMDHFKKTHPDWKNHHGHHGGPHGPFGPQRGDFN
jgi:hypothetical protein